MERAQALEANGLGFESWLSHLWSALCHTQAWVSMFTGSGLVG